MRIELEPQADLLVSWLAAQDEMVHGFLNNATVIERAVEAERCLVARDGEEVVGFITWSEVRARAVEVLIACVAADRRGQGVGRAMLQAMVERLPHPLLLHLQCAPEGSEPFWRGMGFYDWPGDNSARYLYRLVERPHSPPAPNTQVASLTVWAAEPWRPMPERPILCIQLPVAKHDCGEWALLSPLVLLADKDWLARFEAPDGTSCEKKLKYLPLKGRVLGAGPHTVFDPVPV